MKKDFVAGDLHPDDLKKAVAHALNELLQPIRNHFEKNPSNEQTKAKARSKKRSKRRSTKKKEEKKKQEV